MNKGPNPYEQCQKHIDIFLLFEIITNTFNKSKMEFIFTKWLTHNRPKFYELSLRAIQLIKNVAIVHYSYNTKGNWGPGSGRRTSEWMKNNGEWKLTGGMSAKLLP